MKIDILAIGAHPDDIELCCGGTLAKLAGKGRKAAIVDVTDGGLGTRGSRKIRLKEAAKAAGILGCVRENLGLADGNIQVDEASVKKLISVIRRYRPGMMIIPPAQERHPDHVRTHHLCREAWFYSGLRKIQTTWRGKAQDAWRPDNYIQYMQWYEFTPSFIVDISDVYHVRLKAIRAYKSQFFNPRSKQPSTRLSEATFLDFVETRAKAYGARIGVMYGEPFFSVECIGITDPLDLRMIRG